MPRAYEEVTAWQIFMTMPLRYVEGKCMGLDHTTLWTRIAGHEQADLLHELVMACEAGFLQGLKDV